MIYKFNKRLFDIIISLLFISFLSLPILLVSIIIFFNLGRPVFHFSKRFGYNKKIFYMPKFRTMSLNAPEVATHLLTGHSIYIGKVGKFLRKTSIDEVPQFVSVLRGEMTLVGPRPALFNQYDLIEQRELYGIDKLKPGITGLAQILGRDQIDQVKKIKLERVYLRKKSFYFDLKILFLTVFVVIWRINVSH
jgi:O-antigen biosynthesis protein WbqP